MIRRPARATLVPYTTLCRSLQCYEGQDETKALYEWDYGKQLLYTQILREKTAQLLADTDTLEAAVDRVAGADSAFFNERFLAPRPLLEAIRSEEPVVLLVDEGDQIGRASWRER